MTGQLPLPFVAFEPPPTPPPLPRVPVLPRAGAFDVHLVRMRRARRYVLRVRPDGALRVTVPRGGSRAEALRFAERHLAWAERERLRVLARPRTPISWHEGATILLGGVPTIITRERDAKHDVVRAGHITARVRSDRQDVRPALEQALRRFAANVLPPRLAELARLHDLEVARVTIRNQQSRWGACSRRGAITLNFRLVQMPDEVRDYILVHELMHLRQPNHSRRFWRLVEAACPRFRDAERWLKTTGRLLF